jgi:cytochrome c-type biogenesis protein CcmH/NrfG
MGKEGSRRMSEVNIRMLRQTYLNRIRAYLEEIRRTQDKLEEACKALEEELRNRPNAPEGWVKE